MIKDGEFAFGNWRGRNCTLTLGTGEHGRTDAENTCEIRRVRFERSKMLSSDPDPPNLQQRRLVGLLRKTVKKLNSMSWVIWGAEGGRSPRDTDPESEGTAECRNPVFQEKHRGPSLEGCVNS